jgi:hypothetical protein
VSNIDIKFAELAGDEAREEVPLTEEGVVRF